MVWEHCVRLSETHDESTFKKRAGDLMMMPPKKIKFRGETKSIKEWAKDFGIPAHQIHNRLKYGWEVNSTLFKAPRGSRRRRRGFELDGRYYTINEAAKQFGISPNVVYYRLTHGWSPKQIVSGESPIKKECLQFTYEGVHQSLSQWACDYGIPYNTLHARVSLGWDYKRALNTPVKYKKKKGTLRDRLGL